MNEEDLQPTSDTAPLPEFQPSETPCQNCGGIKASEIAPCICGLTSALPENWTEDGDGPND